MGDIKIDRTVQAFQGHVAAFDVLKLVANFLTICLMASWSVLNISVLEGANCNAGNVVISSANIAG